MRNNSYNVVRFIAASLVILGHMFVLSGQAEPRYLGLPVQTQGLNILIVISGYWIRQSCSRETRFASYLTKRLLRLLPALYACVLVTALIIGPVFTAVSAGEYFRHPQFFRYFLNLLLNPQYTLPGAFADNPYPNAANGSLWSLPVEMMLYLVMWVLISQLKKGEKSDTAYRIFAGAVCIIHLLILWRFDDRRLVLWGTDWLGAFDMVPFFFLGGLFCSSSAKKLCNVPLAVIMLLAGLGIHTDHTVINEIASYIIIPYVTVTIGECENAAVLSRAKDVTYGMYLWGFLIQQCLEAVLLKKGICLEAGVMKFGICLAAAYLMGLLSCYTVEEWGSRFRKQCKWTAKT